MNIYLAIKKGTNADLIDEEIGKIIEDAIEKSTGVRNNMTTDQIAAEAVDEIEKCFPSGSRPFVGLERMALNHVIKSAIEKAINNYDAQLDRIQNGKGRGIMHQSRVAQAGDLQVEEMAGVNVSAAQASGATDKIAAEAWAQAGE